MAGQKLTDKSALANHTGTGDLYMIVDVSDTTGSSAGTSKKLDSKYVIQTDKISLADSVFHALNSTPHTLVAAPGAGYAIVPLSCQIYIDYGTTGTSARITVAVTHNPADGYAWGYISDFMRGISTDVTYIPTIGGITSTANGGIDNVALQLYADDNFHGSVDWTGLAYVTYQIIKLS
tara:strand:+ start:614 stop:1147 length:534 start_codon:yes stop_codon:yes gene_type:complete